MQPVTHLDFDAAGLEMRVERIVAVTEVLNDVIARVLLERQTAWALSGNLFGQSVDYPDNATVGDGTDVSPEPGIAFRFGLVAVEHPAIRK